MLRPVKSVLILIVLALAFRANTAEHQWILVTAPAFRTALTPLLEYRRSEGLKVVVIETTNVLSGEQIRQGNAAPLRALLIQLCQSNRGPNYVLLAGSVLGIYSAIGLLRLRPGARGSRTRSRWAAPA